MTTTSPATDAPPSPVQTAIFARRSIRRFEPTPVARDVVEQLLAAAVQAPNHRRTQPWRFFVVADDTPARARLAELAEARLGHLALGNRIEGELHGLVAVRVDRLDTNDRARARLDHRHRRHLARLRVEELGHAELLADDAFHSAITT